MDLPGLTKVAVGDQPEDIEQQIEELIKKYISQDNTIIMAVTPANQDIATSDSLKMARKVDPNGDRTIGVITKLDLMPEGTDALDILKNLYLPLKKGYVGVVNRKMKSVNEARAAEKDFFRHSPYRRMGDKMGSDYLQQVLNQELRGHIQAKLPQIRTEIIKKSREVEEDLKHLGYEEDTNDTELIIRMLLNFSEDIYREIDSIGEDVNTKRVITGVRINRAYIHDFHVYLDSVTKKVNTLELENEISIANLNLHGTREPMYAKERAIEEPIKRLLEEYKSPVMRCVSHVRKLLDDLTKDLRSPLVKYPELHKEVLTFVKQELDKNEAETNQLLATHVDFFKSRVITEHLSAVSTGVKQINAAVGYSKGRSD